MKKIAFLFLIYDIINHEKLWHDFFTNASPNKYTIYIHYKIDVKLQYFDHCKLKNCIPTQWGNISLVKAQNLLLKMAMKDNNNKNFIFCSDSCIPVKPFDYIYKNLNHNFSYFSYFPTGSSFPRCIKTLIYIDKQYIKKASQWCILARKHVALLLLTDIYIKWFDYTIGDEHCYITYLHYLGREHEIIKSDNSGSTSTTYNIWNKWNDKHPVTYNNVTYDQMIELVKSKHFFARKFSSECNLNLFWKIILFIAKT